MITRVIIFPPIVVCAFPTIVVCALLHLTHNILNHLLHLPKDLSSASSSKRPVFCFISRTVCPSLPIFCSSSSSRGSSIRRSNQSSLTLSIRRTPTPTEYETQRI
ncbi:hypothetical protein Dimus_033463 [Dionaea muscipula]